MEDECGIKSFVKDRYGKVASQGDCCRSSCCGADVIEQARTKGYSANELLSVPSGAYMGLGCGNPTALAELKVGETVLDLGSGGGLDVFLAAQRVGDKGRVIGVDMTPEMVEKATQNAHKGGYKNVAFRLGEIESLPVEENCVDVIISNCVINLSMDKLATFKEAFRVLKPGGRMMISDLVTEGELPEDVRRSFEAWSRCIAGALPRHEYLDTIERAGFKDIVIVSEHTYSSAGLDERLAGKITSVQVRASK
ncbi:MAG: arsenite methyltransferase [Chloroflexota bacterium]